MLGRALSLATVTLLIGCFAAGPVRAQNLEAGKSPSQIFAGTCNACHKSPRGLLKTVSPGSLPGFLRQHYTTSSDMASLLSAFLVSNGATDTRYGGSQSKPGNEAKSGGGSEQLDRQGRRMRPGSQEAARPDADGISQGEPGRQGRKRLARPGEGPDETKPAVDGQAPVQAGERGPDDRKLTAKQRLSKRGKPGGEELPKADTAKSDATKPDTAKPDTAKSDAAKSDAAKSDTAKIDAGKTDVGRDDSPKPEPGKDDKPKSETAKEDSGKPEGTKPAGEGKSEAAKIEIPKDSGNGATPVLRTDPVPPVTPAPPAAAATSEQPAAPRPSAPATSEPPPPAVTASAPPSAPVANGPPVPPISQ
jgi:hypothetical protein